MKSDLRPFTHRIYVDFSGDDGDPRTTGASKCICIAWVLSAEEDIWHNQGIVLKIKRIIGCREDAELKYKSLRRHRCEKEALILLSQLKVTVVIVPVLKERISEEEIRNPRTKKLVNLLHYFPIRRLLDYFIATYPDVYFQLIFDEIGWVGCQDAIKESFTQEKQLAWGKERPDWLRFQKSGNSLMLQLADVIAGLGREYVEGLQTLRLPPCSVCWVKNIRDCSYRRARERVGQASLMRLLYPLLLKDKNGEVFEEGFVMRPPQIKQNYLFVDCLFGGK